MSLVNTLMQELRGQYAGRFDKNEVRRSVYGAYDLFRRHTESPTGILTPNVRNLIKRSFGNTVKIPVLDRRTVSIGSTRACTVSDSENTSQLVTLTFATYSFGFTMIPGQYFNNDLDYQVDFSRKLELYINQFLADLDTLAAAALNTNKNVYWTSDITALYSQVGDALQVPQADKNDFYNNAEAIINLMDFYGSVDVVANTVHRPLVSRLVAQGQANAVNEAFQFGPFDFGYTNRITNGAGVESTGYLVMPGNLATENRNDPDAIAGRNVGDVKSWELVQVPGVNLQMGAYTYKDCADYSSLHAGTTGLTRTYVEGFEWSTDIVFVTAYNSNTATGFQPITKFEVLTT